VSEVVAFCPACGRKCSSGDGFCRFCGHELGQVEPAAGSSTPKGAATPSTSQTSFFSFIADNYQQAGGFAVVSTLGLQVAVLLGNEWLDLGADNQARSVLAAITLAAVFTGRLLWLKIDEPDD
jgi:hypothetical protein